MTGLRLTRSVRERYGLSAVELPGQMSEIRRFIASFDGEQRPVGPLRTVHAGQIEAAWLISAALSLVIERYQDDIDPHVFDVALAALEEARGPQTVESVERVYVESFETEPFVSRDQRVRALEEVLTVWLANVNPAFGAMRELFDDAALRATDGYERVISGLTTFFEEHPPYGPDEQPLVAMLRSPAIAFPDSLQGQLAYIRERWGTLLGELLDRLLIGMDILAEEDRAWLLRMQRAAVLEGRASGDQRHPGATAVYDFRAYQEEPEGFTADREWHPRLVLIAKSIYVWLDQLSKKYGYEIHRLDQIPDAELDRIASWGMTGLWLIGIWQRSGASELIKRLRGKEDAAASAYALDDYRVADDLGGEDAWLALSEKAGQRGLKLAADMVPNHMGVDSEWVLHHPEWFLSLPEAPYPAYTFDGPELSPDENVSIVIEDHYWNDTDASVVFKRTDKRTGDTRYIYHGNDGTVMPWNDTAQLNYIDAEVREQVIQTILKVARRFPVIRFDAAMVLTRQHIRRLWWPQPGSGGGAIPSRAEHAISQPAWDQAMPAEFWREVVDRVAAEGLDTLLLAEAFWLLEGYFVRTLGMHRVYNSAFMHMMRDERNEEYHLVMRNTLEFDPEVLKRYVNFMSNPDEDTAVEQFGKDDKYVGIATLLATLPGLPMFAHGQVEGLTEKYGMEYRRAYFDEQVDEWLVGRHERELFPLLRRRGQFAEVRDFLLYDFVTGDGSTNPNVFAFSNGRGVERSLVIYHNHYGTTSGSIRESVNYLATIGSERRLTRRTIGDGLELPGDDGNAFVTFRDHATQLQYVRSARDIRERGFWVELGPFGRHVFLDFTDVHDSPNGMWRQLEGRLAGRGVPSLDDALDELVLAPVQTPFGHIVSAGMVRALIEAAEAPETSDRVEGVIASVLPEVDALIAGARSLGADAAGLSEEDVRTTVGQALRACIACFRAASSLASTEAAAANAESSPPQRSSSMGDALPANDPRRMGPAVMGGALALGVVQALSGHERGAAARLFQQWRLGSQIARMYSDLGVGAPDAHVDAIRLLLSGGPGADDISPASTARRVLEWWVADDVGKRALGVNRWEGVTWIDGGLYAELVGLWWAHEKLRQDGTASPSADPSEPTSVEAVARALLEAAPAAGYHFDDLLTALPAAVPLRLRPRAKRGPNAGGSQSDGVARGPEPTAPGASSPTEGAGSTQTRRVRKPRTSKPPS